MLNGEDFIMSNESIIQLTPTNTPNYQIHSSNKSITNQILQLHRILASASAPLLVLTPGSRMFDGPKKFLWSPIRFNERKSYDQVTQGKTFVGELFTWKNQSNSTLAPFEHMMHRQTNIRCSFKMAERWNGNWSKSAKCGVKERIGWLMATMVAGRSRDSWMPSPSGSWSCSVWHKSHTLYSFSDASQL